MVIVVAISESTGTMKMNICAQNENLEESLDVLHPSEQLPCLSSCWFAHGKEELRSVERHPKYKTKVRLSCSAIEVLLAYMLTYCISHPQVCESFSKTGKCGYGKRCVYIHPRYGDANYQGKSNVLLDASQTLLNANVNLSALQNLSPSVLNEALLACKSRFAGLLGLEFGQDVQKSDQALQHSSSDLQATTQQQKQSVMIPKTPSGGSHELMNCQLSSSPDSPLSGSSTTPTSMISHSPASSTASNKGCQFPLPQWRIHGKSLTQPRFDFLKQPTLPEGFAAGHLPHQKNSFNGEEKENDVFLSSKENEQDFSQAWYLTVNGTKPLAKKDSSMTKSPSDEYLFMIEA